MAGANYMGGKRNAAKARQRDSAGRIQKGFFGRRKMEILTRGLANRSDQEASYQKVCFGRPSGKTQMSTIQLAHAKLSVPDCDLNEKQAKVETPLTPKTITALNSSNSSSLVATRTSSKILQALEINEPKSRRAALDRILALPDLVGLSVKKAIPPSREGAAHLHLTERPLQKRKMTRPSSPLPPSSPWSTWESSEPFPSEQLSPTQRSPLMQDPNYEWEENSDDDSDNQAFSFSPGPAEGFVRQPKLVYSGKSSIQEICGPGSKLCQPSSDKPSESSHGARSAIRDYRTSLPPVKENNEGDDSFQELSFDSKGPSSTAVEEDLPLNHTVPFNQRRKLDWDGNLYEHKDPWHSIGVILGLSPASSYLQPDCEAAFTREEDLDAFEKPGGYGIDFNPEVNYYDWPSEDLVLERHGDPSVHPDSSLSEPKSDLTNSRHTSHGLATHSFESSPVGSAAGAQHFQQSEDRRRSPTANTQLENDVSDQLCDVLPRDASNCHKQGHKVPVGADDPGQSVPTTNTSADGLSLSPDIIDIHNVGVEETADDASKAPDVLVGPPNQEVGRTQGSDGLLQQVAASDAISNSPAVYPLLVSFSLDSVDGGLRGPCLFPEDSLDELDDI